VKLMCVVAHPDDECFGFGGALALAADRGVETYVVCLTDGQAASARGNAADGEELGRMRRAEFAASCKVLGVTHHELMDYDDGRLEFVEVSRAAGRLVERMRRFRPDVVLTFGGEGGLNTHPDHMAVSMLTTAAFHWAGQERRYPELAMAEATLLSLDGFLHGGQAGSATRPLDREAGYPGSGGAQNAGLSPAHVPGTPGRKHEGDVREAWRLRILHVGGQPGGSTRRSGDRSPQRLLNACEASIKFPLFASVGRRQMRHSHRI